MAFTQKDADRIREAIAKGVSSVEVAGEKIGFRSFAEMRSTLRMIEEEIAGRSAGATAVIYPLIGRGLR